MAVVALMVTCLGLTTVGYTYPVPFDDTPDWRGIAASRPSAGAVAFRDRSLKRVVVVVRLVSTERFADKAGPARMAYKNLFENVAHLPTAAAYIVMIIYEPSNSYGLSNEYGYVFKRNPSNRKMSRKLSEKELLAVECAIGQCPNY